MHDLLLPHNYQHIKRRVSDLGPESRLIDLLLAPIAGAGHGTYDVFGGIRFGGQVRNSEQLPMNKQAVNDAMEMELESWSAKWKVTPHHRSEEVLEVMDSGDNKETKREGEIGVGRMFPTMPPCGL